MNSAHSDLGVEHVLSSIDSAAVAPIAPTGMNS